MAPSTETALTPFQTLVRGTFCGRRREMPNDPKVTKKPVIDSEEETENESTTSVELEDTPQATKKPVIDTEEETENESTTSVELEDTPQVAQKFSADSEDDAENNSTSCGEPSDPDQADTLMPKKLVTDGFEPKSVVVEPGEEPEPTSRTVFDAPPGLPPPPGLTLPDAAELEESFNEDQKEHEELPDFAAPPRIIQLFDELPKAKKECAGSRHTPDNVKAGMEIHNIGPPPGLEHPDQTVHKAPKADSRLKTPLLPGTRLKAKASPFVPVFGSTAGGTTPEFTGACHQLDQSLSKLTGAMAEWDVCLANAGKPSVQDSSNPQASGLLRSTVTPVKAHAVPENKTSLSSAADAPMFVPRWQMSVDCRPASQLWQPGSSHSAVLPTGLSKSKTSKADMPATQIGDFFPKMGASDKSGTEQQMEKDSLRTNLRDLEHMDGNRILIVRRINRLGLESPALLEGHFSKYGPVEKVLVSHSRAKSYFGYSSARVRPAGLGFVVMSRAEDAVAILKAGTDQAVAGATITVHAYESRGAAETKESSDGVTEDTGSEYEQTKAALIASTEA